MLFLGVAHFRSGTRKKHDALIGAFSDHLMQPMNPRIRLAGPIFDDSGARSGLFMLLEADSIETIRSFLKHGPYVEADLYERLEITAVGLEVGHL